jgi:hypothetical protein
VLEVSTGDYGDHNGALVAAIQNGKCNDWRRRQTERSSFSYLGKTMNKLYISLVHNQPLKASIISMLFKLCHYDYNSQAPLVSLQKERRNIKKKR